MQLLAVVHATDQGVYLEVGVLKQLFGIFADLNCQLASRRQNQCAGFAHIALVFDRKFEQVIDNADQKGSRFTCTRLCLADHVMATQSMGQRSTLDRCGITKASSLDGLQQWQRQIEVVEAGFALLHFDNKLIGTPGFFSAGTVATTATSATSWTSHR